MVEEKLFGVEEARGLMDVVRNYLLRIEGDLPAIERRVLGRLLDESQASLEASAPPTQVDNVRPWPTLR